MFIYKQYDQASLDRQYNNRLQVPDYITYLERWDFLSRQTEKDFKSIKDIAYGEYERERLDIYPSSLPQSTTLIFIHGGYWQRLDKNDFQFIAKGFLSYNITTVLITYPLAPAVTIDQIVSSCRKAIQWLQQNISSFNGDPDQMYVAGHSAGGHLATMLMCTDPIAIGWKELNLQSNIIKGVCAISGLHNLIPIWLSDINDVLKMDKEMAIRNSPIQLVRQLQRPLIIATGADESDEFKAQGRELYDCWKDKSSSVQLLEIDGLNHYSILETIIDPRAPLHKAVCQLMQI